MRMQSAADSRALVACHTLAADVVCLLCSQTPEDATRTLPLNSVTEGDEDALFERMSDKMQARTYAKSLSRSSLMRRVFWAAAGFVACPEGFRPIDALSLTPYRCCHVCLPL